MVRAKKITIQRKDKDLHFIVSYANRNIADEEFKKATHKGKNTITYKV